MIRTGQAVLAAALLGIATPALAHEVHHEIRQSRATIITLTYADGQPFGGEAFEAVPIAAGQPIVSGRTDAQGRAILLAEVPGTWRLRAWSDDGHGVDLRFEVAALPSTGSPRPTIATSATPATRATTLTDGDPAASDSSANDSSASDPAANDSAVAGLPRWVLVLVGLAVIALAFSLLQRLVRRQGPAGDRRPD